MLVRVGEFGQQWTLGPEEHRGAEGAIRGVVGQGDLVAKVFHQPSAALEEKLRAMVENSPRLAQSLLPGAGIAWPLNLLRDAANGHFIGYILPRVKNARKIFDLYHFPIRPATVGPREIIAVARHLAESMASLHQSGIVIGDLSESNVLVSGTRITFIDTDSFQIRTTTRTFRCQVATPEFAAPEILGLDRGKRDATEEEDRYSLAVMMFLLFMDGNHPYRARVQGPSKGSLLDRVKSGDWPYQKSNPRLSPPLGAPPFGQLPDGFRDFFVRAFADGHKDPRKRPTATEWSEAIRLVQQSGAFEATWKNRSSPKATRRQNKQSLQGPFVSQTKRLLRASPRQLTALSAAIIVIGCLGWMSLGNLYSPVPAAARREGTIVPSPQTHHSMVISTASAEKTTTPAIQSESREIAVLSSNPMPTEVPVMNRPVLSHAIPAVFSRQPSKDSEARIPQQDGLPTPAFWVKNRPISERSLFENKRSNP